MDRAGFLKALGRRLYFRVSREEREQVLADYGEYFDSGAGEGRTEAELCARFGDPADIAAEVAAPNGGKLVLPQYIPALLVVGVIFVALNCCYSQLGEILHWGLRFRGLNRVSWLFLLLSVASLLFCAKGIGQRASSRSTRWCMGLTVLLVVAIVPVNWFLKIFLRLIFEWIDRYSLDPFLIGPKIALVLQSILFLATALWSFWVLRARFLRSHMLAVFPLYAAVACLLLKTMYLLHVMADPATMSESIKSVQQSALWQLAPILLVPLLLRFRGRKEMPWTHR